MFSSKLEETRLFVGENKSAYYPIDYPIESTDYQYYDYAHILCS